MSSRYTHTITASCTSGPEEEGWSWYRLFKRVAIPFLIQLYLAGRICGAEYTKPVDQGSRVGILIAETIWALREGVKAEVNFASTVYKTIRPPQPPTQPTPTPTPCPSPVPPDRRTEIEICEDCPDEDENHRAPCHK